MNEWEWNLLEDKQPIESVTVGGIALKVGDAVRLRPRPRGDVMDLALAGKVATIEAIEQDYEGHIHLAMVLDDDPGKDLGRLRQPGHRFFFRTDEVEPLPRVLVAGIGNIFFGDDGFGVEVAQQMARRALPANARVADFGIRGFDLACALLDGPDVSILVDACPRGATPGTVHVLEPDLGALAADGSGPAMLEPHGLNPLNVLRLATTMGGRVSRIVIVGCEPQTLGGDDGHIGLSAPVAAAVETAIHTIESLLAGLCRESPGPLTSRDIR